MSGLGRDAESRLSLSVDSLSRSFGRITALDDISFDFKGSKIVGVAGPSGCGKTTLIRCLLGLLEPSEGSVSINGMSPNDIRRAGTTKVGYMPQHDGLYPDLTLRQNVSFFAKINRVPRRERSERVQDVIEFIELSSRADDKITDLSGGMKRRTSLASAIVHNPDLVFLDEPTVGLDPALRAQMWEGFKELRKEGSLILLSTHYLAEAARCDSVLFLRDGRVLANDTPKAILDRTGTGDMEDAFLELLEA
ncbi:MAG: ABC transporter ATP-binding protein [Halobacteria archaeon]|nr:ABC transporter ATP-binding protein [Halobacteria archaeon]